MALRLAGIEEDAGAAELDQRAELAAPAAAVQVVFQHALQAEHAVHDLRVEGGRGLDDGAAAPLEEVQEVGFELGGELVLARLAAHHDGERAAVAVQHRVEDGAGRLELIGPQGRAEHVAAEELDIGEQAAKPALAGG